MNFDFRELAPRERYKLLISLVVPRPIALVTSLGPDGAVNAAPFSFFNALGSDPPILALGVGNRDRATPKDTALNIERNGEFVVHIVDEALAPAMNVCAVDFPAGTSEIEAAGLALEPGTQVQVPRIVGSPAAFECREHTRLEIGRNRIIIGEVLHLHLRDELFDAEKFYVRTDRLNAVGRMHGSQWYTKTQQQFPLERMDFEQWQKSQT